MKSAIHADQEFTRAAIGIIAYCFLMNVIARGIAETFAVFLLPMSADTGFSRAQISGIYAVFMLAVGLTAPFLGTLFDRVGGRLIYTVGLTVYAAGFWIASISEALWQMYLGLGVMVGFGVSAMGMAPSTAIISRWFTRRMSFAMGCVNAGVGVGLLIMAPVTHLLIEHYGWRSAYQILAVIILVPVPLALFAPWKKIMRGPARRTPNPMQTKKKPSLLLPGWIWRSRAFWGLGTVFFCTSLSIYLVNVQMVAYLIESGFEPFFAASAYGGVSTIAIIGIIFTGWLADIYGRRLVVTLSYGLSIIGFALIWLTGLHPGIGLLTIALIIYGLGMGARGPIISTLVARLYPANVAGVFGTISIGMGLGAGGGSWLSGALYDLTGGYDAGFMVSICVAGIGLAQFWLIPALATGEHPSTK